MRYYERKSEFFVDCATINMSDVERVKRFERGKGVVVSETTGRKRY